MQVQAYPFIAITVVVYAQWCTSLQAIMWDQSFVWLKFDWLEPSNLSAALHCTIG